MQTVGNTFPWGSHGPRRNWSGKLLEPVRAGWISLHRLDQGFATQSMCLHLTDYSHEIHKFSWSSTMVWNFINPRICGLEEQPPPSHVLMTLQGRTSGRWLSHKDTDWMNGYQESGWIITRASKLSKTAWPFFMNPSPPLVCPALSSLAQGFTSK